MIETSTDRNQYKTRKICLPVPRENLFLKKTSFLTINFWDCQNGLTVDEVSKVSRHVGSANMVGFVNGCKAMDEREKQPHCSCMLNN